MSAADDGMILLPGPIYTEEELREQRRRAKRGGRPSKIRDPEVIMRLLEGIEMGFYYREACQRAGIHFAQLRRWLIRGKGAKPGSPYREFREAFLRSRTKAKDRSMVAWQSAIIKGDWKAAAAFMKARYPEQWARRSVTVSAKGGGPFSQTFNIGAGASVNFGVQLKQEKKERDQVAAAIEQLLAECREQAEEESGRNRRSA